jgi:hypothetical protein
MAIASRILGPGKLSIASYPISSSTFSVAERPAPDMPVIKMIRAGLALLLELDG